jgi:ferredoxin-type protein NapG
MSDPSAPTPTPDPPGAPTVSPSADRAARRRFLAQTASLCGSAGVVGLLLAAQARTARAVPAWALRPPGAIAEDDFTSACVRCGLCVRACPYDILDLATIGSEVVVGTPYFTARAKPCEMCDDIPCAKACPTGALDRELPKIEDARMGVAVLTNRETCWSVIGKARCRFCSAACPVGPAAITLEQRLSNGRRFFEPTVHSEHCTGCGKCEHACPTEEASIKVLPIPLARSDRVRPPSRVDGRVPAAATQPARADGEAR